MPPRKPKPQPCPPISAKAFGQVYRIAEEELLDGAPEVIRAALPRGRGRPRLNPDEPTIMYTIRLPAPLATALRAIDPDKIRTALSRLTTPKPRKPRR